MNREEKRTLAVRLQESLQGASYAVLVDFSGLKVPQSTELRSKVRAEKARFEVVKNRIVLHASGNDIIKNLSELFRGPTAILSGSGDPVGLVRILRDFSKENPALNFKGGWVDGQLLSPEGLVQLAGLPSRQELISRFAGSLVGPIGRLCMAIQSPLRNFILDLKEIARKKS